MEFFAKKISSKDCQDFFAEHGITTDAELLAFLSKQEQSENHIYTPVKTMKENYMISILTLLTVSGVTGLTWIDGDDTGYIYYLSDGWEVCLLQNGKRYTFTFVGLDYFTEADMEELLNTIVIE